MLSMLIPDAEYVAEKYKFVLSHFPDCKLQRHFTGFISEKPIFISKIVNQEYTHLIFESNKRRIVVMPHTKLHFEYNGKKEEIIIHSSPKRSILARVMHDKDKATKQVKKDVNGKYIRKISFARLSVNLKNNNFDDKMLNDCRAHILKFIQENPGYKIDDKHLEPRLKKLLVFT